MTDWTSGYVADIGYTYGCYTELNPLRATLALLDRGIAPPPAGPCCELGFGQGISINVHAAASDRDWWGTDFAPQQAAFATGMARASGTRAHLFDQSFAEFCARTDLPDFAFIGLHGIWSWVSDENRALIVDFIRRKLMVGGLVYMGYNTQPGWANWQPMRNLMTQFGDAMVPPGLGSTHRVSLALDFADKLVSLNPMYARLNPQVPDRLKGLRTKQEAYLAHEFFNRDWHPMAFGDMVRWLAPAKLDYAGSATFSEHIDAMNLTGEQHAFLAAIPDEALRENARDFFSSQQFRKDYWVRGAVPLDQPTQMALLRRLPVVLARHPGAISNSFKGTLGEIELDKALFTPLLEFMADHQPRKLAELDAVMAPRGMAFAQMFQTVMLLVGRDDMALVRSPEEAVAARPQADRLNAAILELAPVSRRDVPFLASPVTGGGIHVVRTHQLFLLAVRAGRTTAEGVADFLRQLIAAYAISMKNAEGKDETAEESVQRLRGEAATFLAETWPALRALGVA